MNSNITFPDINLAITGATNVREICTNYIHLLNSSGSLSDAVYANKLQEYLDVDEKIPMFEDEFHECRKILRKWVKENKTNVFIKTRKKDFIGFNEKIRLFYPDLDKIHDLFGFRLILRTYETDTLESIALCYKLLNDLIRFFVIKKKYELLVAEDLVGVISSDTIISIPDIIIPSKKNNFILEGFENKVKDYIKSPKKDSYYQSLHFCVRTPSGLVFEVQIRTFAMDIRTNHISYKRSKYPTQIDLDYSRITLPGIAFDNNNQLLFDNSGLLRSSDIFNNI